MKLKIIIMAGGFGERFWPKSRRQSPKQFTPIISEKTMLEETVLRLLPFCDKQDIYISTAEAFKNKASELLKDFPAKNIITEPMPKDTACAIGLSALCINASDEDVLFFIPADHFIANKNLYYENIKKGMQICSQKKALVLLGIKPNYPSDGFGYIQLQDQIETNLFTVGSFIEKPNVDQAKAYLKTNHYFWNAGMFFIRKDLCFELFRRYAKTHFDTLLEFVRLRDRDVKKALSLFKTLEKISFDYAIAEKTKEIYCLKADFIWDDVGSWNALSRLKKTDINGNLFSKKVFDFDCKQVTCQVDHTKKTSVVLNGVKDLNIIFEDNILYISHKKKEGDIKLILKQISKTNPELL